MLICMNVHGKYTNLQSLLLSRRQFQFFCYLGVLGFELKLAGIRGCGQSR